MELSRLRQGDLVAGIGGVALLVVMFLDWYAAGGSARFQGQDIDISLGFNAWQAFSITDLILALTALSGIALAVLTASRRSPALPVAASVITTTAGLLATLLVLYRILNQPGPNDFVEVKFGAFLGFLSVLAVAASVITTTTGALAVLLVLYRIVNQPGPNEFIEVKFPAFLGFLCVLAITAGGWLSMRDEEWPDAPMETDVRPAPPAEGPREPAPPPEAEPRA